MTLTHDEAVTCSKYLYGAARNICRGIDINDAHDIVQEALLQLLGYDRDRYPNLKTNCVMLARSVICSRRLRSKKFGKDAGYVKEREPQWYDESLIYRKMVNGTLADVLDPMQFDLCEVIQKRLLLKKFCEKYAVSLTRYYDFRASVLEYLLIYELTNDS